MQRRSLITNGIYAVAANIYSMMIPLVVMPYILRTLGAESYGKISYVQALISYFILLASLGIYNFALRECAVVRDIPSALKDKVSQIFTISLFTTGFSYILYIIYVCCVKEARSEAPLYLVYSVMILSSGLMMDWLYNSLERFDLVSRRSIIGKTIYVILVFIFIKTSGDYVKYAIVYICSQTLIAFSINHYGIWSGKCGVKPTFQISPNLKNDLKSIFYLGMMTLGSKLFSSSDVILTKWLVSDNGNVAVGLYNSAISIPLIIENLLFVIAGVVSPRLFYYLGQRDDEKATFLTNQASNAMYFVAVPAVLTFFFFPYELLSFFGGGEYVGAKNVLRIYSIVLITAVAITLAGTRTYVARKKEKKLFKILISVAMVNILLDVIFIRYWGISGAALATVISNVILMIIELSSEHTWNFVFTKDKLVYVYSALLISILFLVAKFILDMQNIFVYIGCLVCVGIIYVLFLSLMKESTILLAKDRIFTVLKSRRTK